MSKWIALTDAGNPSKKIYIQSANVVAVSPLIQGSIRSEVYAGGFQFNVAQMTQDIISAINKSDAEAANLTGEALEVPVKSE